MRLLKIGADWYLEVISIDPDAEPLQRKRWLNWTHCCRRLVHGWQQWVMRTNDIDRVTNATDLELGVVEEMSRGTLEWQITIPPDGRLPSHGMAPAVIQWKGEAHPALKLAESSVSLLQVVGYHPDARQITALLNAASFEGPFSVVEPADGIAPGLTATFQTQRGVVVLS